MSGVIERGQRPWHALVASEGWETLYLHIQTRTVECLKRSRNAIHDKDFHEAAGWEYAAKELEGLVAAAVSNVRREEQEEKENRHDRTREAPGITTGFRT